MRVTAWSRQSHGQVEAWMLRTRQRWQHPLQPNYNWHRARYDELTLECVWKQGGTDKDRITMDVELKRQARQARQPKNRAASAIPSSARIWRRGHPSRLPYGSLPPALNGPRPPHRKIMGGGEGRKTGRPGQTGGREKNDGPPRMFELGI